MMNFHAFFYCERFMGPNYLWICYKNFSACWCHNLCFYILRFSIFNSQIYAVHKSIMLINYCKFYSLNLLGAVMEKSAKGAIISLVLILLLLMCLLEFGTVSGVSERR